MVRLKAYDMVPFDRALRFNHQISLMFRYIFRILFFGIGRITFYPALTGSNTPTDGSLAL
jgi:hypothetical protein